MIQRKLYISNNKSQIKKEKLVLVREGFLYGLKIEKYKSETSSLNRGITSTPNFVFYDSNTKCLIDFTNQTNTTLDQTISDFFNQIEIGTSFTIYNGLYEDPNLKVTANLNGTYTFRGIYNGIVEADVVSVVSLSSKINRYDKNRFEQIPYLIPNSFKVTDTKTIIKNCFGKDTRNSFNYLGVKIGDYVKITDIEFPTKILDINIDSDGNEYIIVDQDLDALDLTNTKTVVLVYIPVLDSYTIEPNIKETEVGACIEYQNGIIVNCTNNNTISQCRMRSSTTNSITTEISIGTFCSTPETDTAIQTDTTNNLITITSNLVNAVTSINNISGPVLKNNNSKNSFYGRPF